MDKEQVAEDDAKRLVLRTSEKQARKAKQLIEEELLHLEKRRSYFMPEEW